MDEFREREKAFEAKCLHDEELVFKIKIKQNRLFAAWAADLLGYKHKKAEDYINKIILIDLQQNKGETVLQTIILHLKEAKVQISEHRIHKEFERFYDLAHKAIMEKEEV